MAKGDYKTAVTLYKIALDRGGQRVEALQGLAVAMVAAEQFDEAVGVYKRLLELAGPDRTTLFNLGLAQTRLGRFDQAEETYRGLLAQHGDFLQARYNLATLLQAQGKLAQARDVWQRVVADAPDLESARVALAEVLVDLNDAEGAMNQYSQAARINPKLVSNWLNLANAARAAGSYGRAVVASKRAAELAPLDVNVYNLQGQLFLELHRSTGKAEFLDQAVRAWQMSLKLNPLQDDLRQVLQTLLPSPSPATRPSP